MGESLMQRRRVEDEGLIGCKLLLEGMKFKGANSAFE
jgi:hypothetical protein